jgi:IS30 family transposase
MEYRQITEGERYKISALKMEGHCPAHIARRLGRHRSTISRELSRNCSPWDGGYRPSKAGEMARGRRSRSRRNQRFDETDWMLVEGMLEGKWSPEQVSGHLAKAGLLSISHETIYRHVWRDRRQGGSLCQYLRHRMRKRRKRYASTERRGRLLGKRMISERPSSVETRKEFGHWEIDTVAGSGSRDCIVTLVERATGYVLIGKLRSRSMHETAKRSIQLLRRAKASCRTITADNGTEFHAYKKIEKAIGATVYFALPYHSWERGSNENANGLIRQYLPRGKSMVKLTQHDCNKIANDLNSRPRKRYGYETPAERFQAAVALQS